MNVLVLIFLASGGVNRPAPSAVGPFTAGVSVSFRTRVSNSNPGFVTSPVVSVIA